MPGLDRRRITGLSAKELDQITCSLCQNVFVYPINTQCCGHTYCRECIEYWLTLNTVCPNDRQPMNLEDLIQTPEDLMNQLLYLRVKCDNHLKGCQTVVRISEMESHMLDCEFNVCPDCGLERGRGYEHNCFENLKKKLEALSEENQKLIAKQDIASIVNHAKNDINNYFIKSIKGFDDILLNVFVKHCKNGIDSSDNYGGVAKHIFLNIKNVFTLKSIHWIVLVNSEDNCVACLSAAKYVLDICFDNLEIKIIGFK